MEHSPAGNGTTRIGPPHGYLPIEEHGIVGDLRTVALIGTDGTVDWYCPARFDAPSLFGALLDKNKGGYFSITARTSYAKPKQLYLPDTNILLTRFQGKDAVGEVIDFMVPETRSTGKARDLLVRQARAVRGTVTFELACHPAFDYGRLSHELQIIQGVGAVFASPLGRAVLRTDVSLKAEDDGVAATFTLQEGESADFHLEWNGDVRPVTAGETDEALTRTQDFWQGWLGQSRYRGRWRETVQRSALALHGTAYPPFVADFQHPALDEQPELPVNGRSGHAGQVVARLARGAAQPLAGQRVHDAQPYGVKQQLGWIHGTTIPFLVPFQKLGSFGGDHDAGRARTPADGVRSPIYVEESGSGDTCVVFESGNGAGRTLWDPVVPLLADIRAPSPATAPAAVAAAGRSRRRVLMTWRPPWSRWSRRSRRAG